MGVLIPEPLDRLRPDRNLLDLIQHKNRPALARFGCLDARSLPLLLDPIPAPQRGFVGARKASAHVMRVDHLPHESCLSNLAGASDRLDKAARLAKPSGEYRSLRANERQDRPLQFTQYVEYFCSIR